MKTLDELEAEIIRDRMLRLDDNKSAVAKSLGITLKTLYTKLERLGLHKKGEPVPRGRPRKKPTIEELQGKVKAAMAKGLEAAAKIKFKEPDRDYFDRLANVDDYREPTPEERDDWYNRDSF